MASSSLAAQLVGTGTQDLYGGWRDITGDVRRLAHELRAASGVCACGHLALDGQTCRCCVSGRPRTDCHDCAEQVVALGRAVEALVESTLRFLPTVDMLLAQRSAPVLLQTVADVRRHILTVTQAYRDLASASEAFSRDCQSIHVPELAHPAEALLHATWTVAQTLEPHLVVWRELQAPHA
ncbi:hypothetical protein [Luteitalea sp.]